MTSEKRKAIVAFVATHDWSYQLVADHFQITRNQVAGVLFRHRYPVLPEYSPRSHSSNKIGTGYRRGPDAAHTVCTVRKKGECGMELTRAERRERVKAFHAHIAHRAALLLPLAKAIKPEAIPAEPDPPADVGSWVKRQKENWFSIVGEIDQPPPTVENIMCAVAREFGVSKLDIKSARRTANLVVPRQVTAYLAKVVTGKSLPDIGRRIGGRDHTTILYSVRKIEHLQTTDTELAGRVEKIRASLA